MPCTHLKELFDLCQKHDLQISSQDAIKVVCRQCEEQEVCPSSLTDGVQVLQLPDGGGSRSSEAQERRADAPE
jgi:hypothetical protein